MKSTISRAGWVGRLIALPALLFLLNACSTTTTVMATPVPVVSDDDDFSELMAQLRADLTRHNSRQLEGSTPTTTASVETKKERDKEFAARAKALFDGIGNTTLAMPVVGVKGYDLYNSWGAARDGGRRKHRGIDIFAPKGTAVVAVADGIVSYIGEQPKGGQCIWLTTEAGASFYYAHLDRWAPGLYEGMEVRTGDLLGYVGNTGNAKTTPPHLHFGINENDEMVNPYPILTKATPVQRARVTVDAGSAMGTR
ncbi:MAG TPA: M23 family metallopeptidase [Thermoanaerobaculia bacterium]|nr:M23 family metallopeptidase [Thermoanaerobaculia bacterium]